MESLQDGLCQVSTLMILASILPYGMMIQLQRTEKRPVHVHGN